MNEKEETKTVGDSKVILLEPPKLKDFNVCTYEGTMNEWYKKMTENKNKYLSISLCQLYGDYVYGETSLHISDQCLSANISCVNRKSDAVNMKALEVGLTSVFKYMKTEKIAVDEIIILSSSFNSMKKSDSMDTAYQLELILADIVKKQKITEVPVFVLVPVVNHDDIFMTYGEVKDHENKDKKKKKKKGKK